MGIEYRALCIWMAGTMPVALRCWLRRKWLDSTMKLKARRENPNPIKSDEWYEWVYRNRVRKGLPIFMTGDNPELAPGADPGTARHHSDIIREVRAPRLAAVSA